MLIRLLPEQLRDGWDLVRPMIVETLPSSLRIEADAIGNILGALLREEAQFWVYYRREGDGRPLAIAVTSVVTDRVAGANYLLVYSMFALESLTNEDYLKGLDTLKQFAGANGCKQVLAYVEDDRFLRLLVDVGAQKITNLVRL